MSRIEDAAEHLRIPIYQVDAFADAVFKGNPAAVCVLEEWLTDDAMQQISAENNLSETAFITRRGSGYDLRWFTPTHEVDLCGHATLAAAFVVLTQLEPSWSEVAFQTRSGELLVQRSGSMLTMNFPTYRLTLVENPPPALVEGLRAQPQFIFHAVKNYYAVFEREDEVKNLQPDMLLLSRLHPNGVSVSAPGSAVDFVSRYFAPSYGIPEDPVSGHPHCALTPYWSQRLGKLQLHARQISDREGDLLCELHGERVTLAGRAALYLAGEIYVPIPHRG